MDYQQQNKNLVKLLKAKGITDKKVLNAILKTPRHLFVLDEYKDNAYSDYPLPIGYSQTISQPYTAAFMLQALELKETDKVLEIGTGSGWNAALTAQIVRKGFVYTTEIIPELVKSAKDNIRKIRLKNIKVIESDGSKGYEKEKQYDKIIITAAAPRILDAWIEQLKPGGTIIAPVGGMFGQEMLRAKKISKDKLEKQSLGYFAFVPLTGKCQ